MGKKYNKGNIKKFKPAIFLDRDGVICKEKGYITSFEQIELYSFAKEAIKRIKLCGYRCIIVTNQSAVARRLILEDELIKIHKQIQEFLDVDHIYYCPHYLKDNEMYCNCRKPNPGMILKGAKEYKIDLLKSFIVGDRASDIIAGKRAQIKTVLVKTGYGEKGLEENVAPDYVFMDLLDFVNFLEINFNKKEL